MVVETSSLYNLKRFREIPISSSIFFILYIPLGLMLLVLRILVSFQYMVLLALLPKQWLMRRILTRVYYFFIGIFVTCQGKHHCKKEAKVLVSNHISLLDDLVIEAISPSRRLKEHTRAPVWLAWLFGLELPEDENRGSDFPLAYYPECAMSNGEVGLMKFKTQIFENMKGILQPLVISSYRPWFVPANISSIRSRFVSDLMWILFSPFTKFHLCYLPVRVIPDDREQIREFVTSLQKDMAYVLGVEPTSVTSQDLMDLIKRIRDEEQQEERRLAASMNTRVNSPRGVLISNSNQKKLLDKIRMIEQVKTVLPQVPFKVIQHDLEVTKNIDLSITRLIDGTVVYAPLNVEEQEKEKKLIEDKKNAVNAKIESANSSASFSKNWKDRHFTFQEKKRIMIEEARRKYIEKHPEYA